MTRDLDTVPPIVREVRVTCDQATTFALFTSHIGAWWPLATHSVHGPDASVAFEGDRLVERLGSQVAVWGHVLAEDPPRSFRMTWHPGSNPADATEVGVEFLPDGDGTIVRLTHSGWERLAEGAARRERYDSGWVPVLSSFAAQAG
jgi:hypothetical protein